MRRPSVGWLAVAGGICSLIVVTSAPVGGAGRPMVGNAFPGRNGEILFSNRQDGHLYVMRADGARQRQLTRGQEFTTNGAWSPNGRWIAFAASQEEGDTSQLHVMRPDGTGRRQVTRGRWSKGSPAWSPDGRHLAFNSSVGGATSVWVINVDGTGLQRLSVRGGPSSSPAWSPDGTTIAYEFIRRSATASVPRSEIRLMSRRWIQSPASGRPARPLRLVA